MTRKFRKLPYRDLYMRSDPVDPQTLSGEYEVHMLGIWPSLRRLGHRKSVYVIEGEVRGHNVVLGGKCGLFTIRQAESGSSVSQGAAEIDYNLDANPRLIRSIRDYVRCIEDGKLYIGRFGVCIAGSFYPLGYFIMEKV